MQGNAVGEWDLGGVLDDMFTACWGVGLCGSASASAVWWRTAICLLPVCVSCVCAGPFRASEPEVPGGGALVGWVF